MSSLPRPGDQFDRLYFGYGSNNAMAQMAERCPLSTFIGKGTLKGYRWQINERGVGNVVESEGDYVEGLLFSLSRKDERSLDRHEGVVVGFYHKLQLTVHFEPVRDNVYFDCKSSYVARKLEEQKSAGTRTPPGKPEAEVGLSEQQQNPQSPDEWRSGDMEATPEGAEKSQVLKSGGQGGAVEARPVEALVYVSKRHMTDGRIRHEYVARMKRAIADSIALGVSEQYVKTYMEPLVLGPTMEATAKQKMITEAQEKLHQPGHTSRGETHGDSRQGSHERTEQRPPTAEVVGTDDDRESLYDRYGRPRDWKATDPAQRKSTWTQIFGTTVADSEQQKPPSKLEKTLQFFGVKNNTVEVTRSQGQ